MAKRCPHKKIAFIYPYVYKLVLTALYIHLGTVGYWCILNPGNIFPLSDPTNILLPRKSWVYETDTKIFLREIINLVLFYMYQYCLSICFHLISSSLVYILPEIRNKLTLNNPNGYFQENSLSVNSFLRHTKRFMELF